MFTGTLVGAAGSKVLIEEFLTGEEVSFIGLSDGENVLPLEPSQDHKTIFDGDQGPNTGGMGAYSDSRLLTTEQRDFAMREVMDRTVQQMKAEGAPFQGFLYAGLMMTDRGPMVLEFNVRLGDPETQALLHRMDCDFGALLFEAAKGRVQPSLLHFKMTLSLLWPPLPRPSARRRHHRHRSRRSASVLRGPTTALVTGVRARRNHSGPTHDRHRQHAPPAPTSTSTECRSATISARKWRHRQALVGWRRIRDVAQLDRASAS